MTIRELAEVAEVGFGLWGELPYADPVIVMPDHIRQGVTLVWTCEGKHLDDERIRAHRWDKRLPEGGYQDWGPDSIDGDAEPPMDAELSMWAVLVPRWDATHPLRLRQANE